MTSRLLTFESTLCHLPLTLEDAPNKPSISYDLPDDVFQAGEQKPSRPKKKVTKRVVSAAQKRPIDAVDVSTCLGTTANSVTASKYVFSWLIFRYQVKFERALLGFANP